MQKIAVAHKIKKKGGEVGCYLDGQELVFLFLVTNTKNFLSTLQHQYNISK